MTDLKIKIVGDSHCRFLGGSAAKPVEGVEVDWTHGKNVVRLNSEIEGDNLRLKANAVPRFQAYDTVLDPACDLVVFSGPFHTSAVVRHPTWKRHCHWEMADELPDLQPVSMQVLEAIIRQQSERSFRVLKLAKSMNFNIAVLEAPKLPTRALNASGIVETNFVDIDRRYRSLVRKHLQDLDVAVIDTPDETHDNNFLKPAFQAQNGEDLHHGNFAYSKLALQSVFDHAQKTATSTK